MAQTKTLASIATASAVGDLSFVMTDAVGKAYKFKGEIGGGVGKRTAQGGEIFNNATSAGNGAHAEGTSTVASGANSHAGGFNSVARGENSFAHGNGAHSSGESAAAFSKGVASSECSFAACNGTSYADYSASFNEATAFYYDSFAIGRFNDSKPEYPDPTYNVHNHAFAIGNGESLGNAGNAFVVFFDGNVNADGSYTTPAADYAEMFEWEDGNVNNEDRVGFLVEIKGEKIFKATSKSKNVIGIVSAMPAIIGDNPIRWHDEYAVDEWGRRITEEVEVEYEETEIVDGVPQNVKKKRTDIVFKRNPLYDSKKTYSERTDRQEWSAVGMLGKLLVRQDGTLKVGSYCTSNDEGIATDAKSGYYVMKVVSPTQALVLVK